MTVGKLKELLNQFDDRQKIVVNVQTIDNQDNDYEWSYDYLNILKAKDVGLNLITLEIETIFL